MACTALLREDTDPAPASAWQIAPGFEAEMLPSGRRQPSSNVDFTGQPPIPAACRNESLLFFGW